MIKNNKFKLIISSVLILLPILVGLLLWEKLPEELATHWGADGNANGWSSKPFAVLGMPLILLIIHWICIIVTALDPKNKGQNRKVFGLVIWIVPILSIFVSGIIYASALGKPIEIETVSLLLIGVLFTAIGNYLPKCKQNHTIGIKIKWTLEDEGNWNATHRFCGKLWVAGGLLLMACIFLPKPFMPFITLIILVALVITSFLYSYIYYKRNK